MPWFIPTSFQSRFLSAKCCRDRRAGLSLTTDKHQVYRKHLMNQKRKWIRQAVSVGLSAVMLVIWISVPLLERADLVNEPVVESEHNPSTCPPAHDHTVCTQVVANLAAPSVGLEEQQQDVIVRDLSPAETDILVHSVLSEGHPSRAPPLA